MGEPYDELWKKRYSKGQVIGSGTWYERTVHEDEWTLNHDFAACHGNGSTVRIGRNVSATPGGFGGAKEWPRVAVEVALPADREDLAEELSVMLRERIAEFLQRVGLNPRPKEE